ncbi:MAG: acyl-CoA thioesterase [Cyanobacteria bacterium]|nr:acyl-CoA thioesterase [Cyanobacteria bacterium CG_2015-16_32_12]NCO77753.1 acyl-CoA thioesterase [Cyanobacteria bacterium CG_2015-22_32_23]NCQ04429.1 acyl-CoA thioesterase [Cyanobacteria bacterium CG_2015-09_32_10]NCQ42110.1 acyl-CoA thioesterase [Cyanobacteria bacterium CG_2015-04_32_10]NCS83569.1 acyl-CoA thioesterase [Cyanobacteria bacterium CG_2015-02_32_10]
MNKFSYQRKIYFADTDGAGVVYFTNLLSICHESYEEYLSYLTINLQEFFTNKLIAIPIIHAQIDFFKPLFCGDVIIITLEGKLINNKVFEISYEIYKENVLIAKALTRHICINPQSRKTQEIPLIIKKELEI